MKVYAAIVRVSHMGARKAGDANVHADRDQVDGVNRYAAKLGARVEFMEPELSVSGGKPINERPSLLAAIEGVETGRYDGIIVAYLSRLTRSRSGLEIWERVEAAGGHVHCAAEDLDTSTPNGRFIRDIHLANAVREREEHVDRFEDRRRFATEAGVWQRRQTPTGYDKDPDTRKLVPNQDAELIAQAFRDRPTTPVAELADRLAMTTSGVRYLLRNRVYLGELAVGRHVNPRAHPAIVTIDEFEAAQTHVPRPGRRGDQTPALLAGIIRCAGCGHVLSRARTAAVVYTCPGRHSGGRCTAPAAITAHLVDKLVEDIAIAELDTLKVKAAAGRGAIDAAREQLAQAERELSAYLEAISTDDVGIEAFRAAARARQEAVDQARGLLRHQLDVTPLIPTIGTGREAWDTLDGHGRNALLRALLEVVIVRRGGGRGSRTPLADRVRIVAHGTGLPLPLSGAGKISGIVPLAFPDADDEGVLRVPGTKDPL